MILKCECCGFEQDFTDGEAAFQAGWDAPPYFTQYIACNLCPAVCIVLPGQSHEIAHALWAREGRPKEWTHEKCAPDAAIGEPKKRAEFEQWADGMSSLLKQIKESMEK